MFITYVFLLQYLPCWSNTQKYCGLHITYGYVWGDTETDLAKSCFELLYTSVFMCRIGKVTVTHLATGDYEVQDVRCRKCSTSLGWTYLKAFNEVVQQRLCICHQLVVAVEHS